MYNTKPVEVFEFHRSMLIDAARTDSFLSALMQTVKPGDVVLDIGSGTGVLACFACLAGAKHVYAIEQGPVIGLAREICARNGLRERVTFINDWSSHTKLPELVDVLVTETIGNMGFEEGILGWVLDAKRRFLKEDAQIIPRSLEMLAVPFESLDDYIMVDDWDHYFYTLDFTPLHAMAANNLLWMDLQPAMYLSDPASLFTVDLAQVVEGDINTEASFIVTRKGSVHGFGGWFAAELAEGINLSNVPPTKAPSWSNTFLPLETPLEVEAGDRLDFKISTSGHAARWQWEVSHHLAKASKSNNVRRKQSTKAGELSTFVISEDLTRVPTRNANAEIDLFILQHIDGKLPISEIARQTEAQFPDKFASYESLLGRIYRLITMYAKSFE